MLPSAALNRGPDPGLLPAFGWEPMPEKWTIVVIAPVAATTLKTVPTSPLPPSWVVPHRAPAPSFIRPASGASPGLGPPMPVNSTTVVSVPVATLTLKIVPRSLAPPDCVVPQTDPAPSFNIVPHGAEPLL